METLKISCNLCNHVLVLLHFLCTSGPPQMEVVRAPLECGGPTLSPFHRLAMSCLSGYYSPSYSLLATPLIP